MLSSSDTSCTCYLQVIGVAHVIFELYELHMSSSSYTSCTCYLQVIRVAYVLYEFYKLHMFSISYTSYRCSLPVIQFDMDFWGMMPHPSAGVRKILDVRDRSLS